VLSRHFIYKVGRFIRVSDYLIFCFSRLDINYIKATQWVLFGISVLQTFVEKLPSCACLIEKGLLCIKSMRMVWCLLQFVDQCWFQILRWLFWSQLLFEFNSVSPWWRTGVFLKVFSGSSVSRSVVLWLCVDNYTLHHISLLYLVEFWGQNELCWILLTFG
jgi:hypothetical protein